MALIKCKECGKEISSEAVSCPQCGHPIKIKNSTNNKETGCGTRILIVIVALIIFGYIFDCHKKESKHQTKYESQNIVLPEQTISPSPSSKPDLATRESSSQSLYEKRAKFAQTIARTPGVLKAEWQNPLSLWIQVNLNSLGSPPEARGKEVADMVANSGYDYIDQPICVTVYYGNFNQLAKTCRN